MMTTETVMIEMADGSTQEFYVDLIQSSLDETEAIPNTDFVRCGLCDRLIMKNGIGPHHRSHLQAAGLVQPRRSAPKKKLKKKAPAKKEISVEDACIGLLFGVTGVDTIPLTHLRAVSKWIADTEKLVKEITS